MTAPDSTDSLVVAAFDVDGTLTTSDCVAPFLRQVVGLRRLAVALVRSPVASGTALLRRDRDALKAIAASSLAGLRWADVLVQGEMFAERVHRERLRPDTVARLAWHRAQGHRIVLVSASLRPYLVPLGLRLGVDAVLCCELEVLPDGTMSGRLDGPNCRGEEKVRRLREWLALNGLRDAQLWAYGDSAGDRALLGAARRSWFVRGSTISASPDGVA